MWPFSFSSKWIPSFQNSCSSVQIFHRLYPGVSSWSIRLEFGCDLYLCSTFMCPSQFHAAQALAEVMNLLHEVETLTKTLKWSHFVLWKKMDATQPQPGRCCGGTLVWSPWLLLKSLAGLLCAMWRDGNMLHHWAGLGQMPEYIGDFILVEDPVWQLCENLQVV